jgi:hypothetical protein
VKTVFKDKIILLTGGTGSFGRAFTPRLIRERAFRALRILSPDELKQIKIRAEIQDERVRLSLHEAAQLVFDAISRPSDGERIASLQRGIESAGWISRRSRLTALRPGGLPWVPTSGSGGVESKPFTRPASRACGSSACVRMSSCSARKSEIYRSRFSRRLAMPSQAGIANTPMMQTGDQPGRSALERVPAARGRHPIQGQAAPLAHLAWEQSTRRTVPKRVPSFCPCPPHAARAVAIVVPTIVQEMSFRRIGI